MNTPDETRSISEMKDCNRFAIAEGRPSKKLQKVRRSFRRMSKTILNGIPENEKFLLEAAKANRVVKAIQLTGGNQSREKIRDAQEKIRFKYMGRVKRGRMNASDINRMDRKMKAECGFVDTSRQALRNPAFCFDQSMYLPDMHEYFDEE